MNKKTQDTSNLRPHLSRFNRNYFELSNTAAVISLCIGVSKQSFNFYTYLNSLSIVIQGCSYPNLKKGTCNTVFYSVNSWESVYVFKVL